MAKAQKPEPEPVEEKDSYTKEEMQEIVKNAQIRQSEADSMRIHGNAFFAESLDHIGGLAQKDKFWQAVYRYGAMFKQSFEGNTGQVSQPPRPKSAPATPAKQAKEKAEEKSDDLADDTSNE